jgi:hypothetical protein
MAFASASFSDETRIDFETLQMMRCCNGSQLDTPWFRRSSKRSNCLLGKVFDLFYFIEKTQFIKLSAVVVHIAKKR